MEAPCATIERDKHALPYYSYAGNFVPTCFAVAAWSEHRVPQPAIRPYRPATQSGSVSGKISAVGGGSFSVDVKKSQESVTLKFLIDDNTKIDGKLKVGAMATVDYRNEDVNNYAVHVVVHQQFIRSETGRGHIARKGALFLSPRFRCCIFLFFAQG